MADDSALIAEAERLAREECPVGRTAWRASRDANLIRLVRENWQPEDDATKVCGEVYRALPSMVIGKQIYDRTTAVIRAALDKAKSDEREACFNIALANGAFSTTAAIRNRGDKS